MKIISKTKRAVRRRWRALVPEFDKSELNLNVGSGFQTIPGFVSLDLDSDWYRKKGRRFLPYNMITDDLPCDSGTVSNIYCSHVIEHLPDEPVARFFSEAHRVLKASGVLRIACPDTEFLWEVSSFPNSYWAWRVEWFNDRSFSRQSERQTTQADYFVREVATPISPFGRRQRKEVGYSDAMFGLDRAAIVSGLQEGLSFDPEAPGDHINAWDFDKVRSFGTKAGFGRIIRSKHRGSVSAAMQNRYFDGTEPQMSLYVDLVK